MWITARTPSVSRSRRVVTTPVGAAGVSLGGDGVHRLVLEDALQRGLEVAGLRPFILDIQLLQVPAARVFQFAGIGKFVFFVGGEFAANFFGKILTAGGEILD